MQPGHDYVLVGRRAALGTPFERLIEDLDRALRRIHAGGKGAPATPHSQVKAVERQKNPMTKR